LPGRATTVRSEEIGFTRTDLRWCPNRLAGIFATYQTAGLWPAMAQFGQAVGLPAGPAAPPPGAGAAPETAAMLARGEENMRFWMEHEFRPYPAYHPHLDALAAAGKIVPAGGRDSREKGNMPFLSVVTLAAPAEMAS
jgi:hypothetical protein